MLSTLIVLVTLGSGSATNANTGQELLRKVERKLNVVNSISGELTTDKGGVVRTVTFKALRPRYYSLESSTFSEYATGSRLYYYWPREREYRIKATGHTEFPPQRLPLVFQFFTVPAAGGIPFVATSEPTDVRYDKRHCQVVELKPKFNQVKGEVRLYIDVDQMLPAGIVVEYPNRTVLRETYRKVQLNPGLKVKEFRWNPPLGAVSR